MMVSGTRLSEATFFSWLLGQSTTLKISRETSPYGESSTAHMVAIRRPNHSLFSFSQTEIYRSRSRADSKLTRS